MVFTIGSLKTPRSYASYAVFLLLLLSTGITHAQTAPAIEWQKSLGGSRWDYAYSIQQTTDEGYIVAGWTRSNDGDVTGHHGGIDTADVWIVKLTTDGDIEWQKSLGGSRLDGAYSIQQTSDGGYIVAGLSHSNNGDVTGHHGSLDSSDVWVVKLTTDGDIEWQKSLGGSNRDYAASIQQTADGGYIVAGTTESNDGDVIGFHGWSDCWIVKLTTDGNIEWQKSLGGSRREYANSIQQTNDGGYIVAGESSSEDGDVIGDHASFDYWIVKLAIDGYIEWQRPLGGILNDNANSIQQTSDGGYIVAGRSSSQDGDVSGNHGGYDYWIVKLATDGDIEWQESLGGSRDDNANSIQQTTDGGYIVAGSTESKNGDVSGNSWYNGNNDYWIVKLATDGDIEWQKALGGIGSDDARSIQQTKDGGYIVSGQSYSNNGDVSGNHGYLDYWIVKLAPEGHAEVTTSPSPIGVFISSIYQTKDEVTIHFESDHDKAQQIKIYDVLGKLVKTARTEIGATSVTISTAYLTTGTYVARLGSTSQMFVVRK